MEQKTAAEKKWYSQEEVREFPKSDFYREELAQYLGQQIVMNVPYYEFKPFKEDKNRACLRQGKVIGIGDDPLSADPIMTIEHIWVAIKKCVKIDSRKPIRVIGISYEYPRKCGNKIVRNVGLKVSFVTQSCFLSA